MANIHDIIWNYSSVCKEEKKKPNEFIMKTLEAERTDVLKLEKERQRSQSITGTAATDSDDLDEPVKSNMFLRLCGNNKQMSGDIRLTDSDISTLMKTFLKCKNSYVTRLDLRYNNITDKGAEIISEYLQTNPILKEIDLMCNDIGEEGAKYLAKSLCENENLLMLKLNGNKIQCKGGLYLAQMLQINNTLLHLDIGETNQKTESLIAMSTVLNRNDSLKGLNLNRAILFSQQEETTIHFSKMLKVNRGLVELRLRHTDIKDFGAERLAACLRDNMTLQYLDLSCNRIARDGAKHLAELLKSNSTLRVLDLHANRIQNDGAKFIADALSTYNITLTTLGITNNSIEAEGLCAIAESLHMNTGITNVYIWGNKFEDSCCKAFAELIDSERLQVKNLDVNPYEVDGVSYFANQSNSIEQFYYWEPFQGKNLPVKEEVEIRYAGT
ncbi:uncharacterized protein LOC141908626 [Tubulanus polymorphus]|uniref:uncharacterized protein LOC141908626 n=1 Tax=Tubulanus polymorphus TaxID=672921 RepID=UPI003DA517F4